MGNQSTTTLSQSRPTISSPHVKSVKFSAIFDMVEPTKLTPKDIFCVKEDHMMIFAKLESPQKNVNILHLLRFPPEKSSIYYEKISEAVKNDKTFMIWYKSDKSIIYCVEIDKQVYSASEGLGFMTGSNFTKI